jgi:hypothetical protein
MALRTDQQSYCKELQLRLSDAMLVAEARVIDVVSDYVVLEDVTWVPDPKRSLHVDTLTQHVVVVSNTPLRYPPWADRIVTARHSFETGVRCWSIRVEDSTRPKAIQSLCARVGIIAPDHHSFLLCVIPGAPPYKPTPAELEDDGELLWSNVPWVSCRSDSCSDDKTLKNVCEVQSPPRALVRRPHRCEPGPPEVPAGTWITFLVDVERQTLSMAIGNVHYGEVASHVQNLELYRPCIMIPFRFLLSNDAGDVCFTAVSHHKARDLRSAHEQNTCRCALH